MTWFRHDSSAHLDEKMIVLRKRHGWGAVGVYWLLVSLCYEGKGEIESYKLPIIFEANEITEGQAMFSTMVDLSLFKKDSTKDCFYSKRVLEELNKEEEWRKLRSEAGKAGGQASAEARKKAKNPTTVEQPSSTRQRTSTISTTDRTVPTIPTLPNQAAKKNFADEDIERMKKPFLEFSTEMTDQQTANIMWDKAMRLPKNYKYIFLKKVNVILNSLKSVQTRRFAEKVFYEAGNLVQDFSI